MESFLRKQADKNVAVFNGLLELRRKLPGAIFPLCVDESENSVLPPEVASKNIRPGCALITLVAYEDVDLIMRPARRMLHRTFELKEEFAHRGVPILGFCRHCTVQNHRDRRWHSGANYSHCFFMCRNWTPNKVLLSDLRILLSFKGTTASDKHVRKHSEGILINLGSRFEALPLLWSKKFRRSENHSFCLIVLPARHTEISDVRFSFTIKHDRGQLYAAMNDAHTVSIV